ncbi:MAG: hypothetical protein P8X79_16815 [Reinekea sp.]
MIPLCFPKNINEPMGAPAIFEQQIEIKLLHPASTLKSRIQVLHFTLRPDNKTTLWLFIFFTLFAQSNLQIDAPWKLCYR